MPKTKPKILVTGARGQVGQVVKDHFLQKYELILTDIDNLDITDKRQVDRVIKLEKPDFIIHTAAFTRVDEAEENAELCQKINALGTKNLAEAAQKIGATLIYISTDYVFDGQKHRPYTEKDQTNPLSVYGKTKLEGEHYVEQICRKYYIIRTAWVFGEGRNFVKTMLKLSKEKKSLEIVDDQIGSPTYAQDLVFVIKKIIEARIPYGIYNFSGLNPCSWYDFAREIFKQTDTLISVKPVSSSAYPQKAQRPEYAYLDKQKIQKTLGIKIRSWREMLSAYLS